MTAQTLYNKLNSGEITKNKFLYEIRKQNLPNITKFNSFNDTIKILKNKGIISETKKETTEVPEVQAATIDMVSPYEYNKGINFELKLNGVSIINNLPTEAEILKAQKKVLKNLGKDKYYYSRKLMSDEEKKLEKNNEREYELTDKNTIHNKKKGIIRENVDEMKHPEYKGKNSYLTRSGSRLSKDEREAHKKTMSDFQKRLKKVSNRIDKEKQGVEESMYSKPDNEVEDSFSLGYLIDTILEEKELQFNIEDFKADYLQALQDPSDIEYAVDQILKKWIKLYPSNRDEMNQYLNDYREDLFKNVFKEPNPYPTDLDNFAELDDEPADLDEGEDDELEAAKEEARRISKEEGVAQHVNQVGNGYRVEDWYDADSTVASYESGRLLETDSTSPWNDSDYETEEDDIEILLSKYGLDRNWFDKHIIELDGLDEEELRDLEYIEDRIQSHLLFQGANTNTPSDDAMNFIDDEEEINESETIENPEWRRIIEDIIGEWGLKSFDMSDEDVMDEVQKEVMRRTQLNESLYNWKKFGIEFLETEIENSGEPDGIISQLQDTLNKLQNGDFTTQDELEDEISDYYEEFAGLDYYYGDLNEYGGDDEGSIETDDENQAKKLADQGKKVILKDKE